VKSDFEVRQIGREQDWPRDERALLGDCVPEDEYERVLRFVWWLHETYWLDLTSRLPRDTPFVETAQYLLSDGSLAKLAMLIVGGTHRPEAHRE